MKMKQKHQTYAKVSEAAEYLACSRHKVDDLIRAKCLQCVNIGPKTRRIRWASLRAYVRANTTGCISGDLSL